MQPTGECINWEKGKDLDGYGYIDVKKKRFRAHRYFWEQRYGKIPEGLVIDHLCRNTSCINLDHLEIVTVKENTHRGLSCKLNENRVMKIRKLYQSGQYSQRELAFMFSVHQSNISRVINERSWN